MELLTLKGFRFPASSFLPASQSPCKSRCLHKVFSFNANKCWLFSLASCVCAYQLKDDSQPRALLNWIFLFPNCFLSLAFFIGSFLHSLSNYFMCSGSCSRCLEYIDEEVNQEDFKCSQECSFASLYMIPEPPSMLQSILLGWISSLIGRAYSKQQAQGLPTWLFLLTPVPILRPMSVFSDALSWSTLHDPMDCSPPGSSVLGILQARILQWVTISSSRGSSWPKDWTLISCFAGGFF